MSRAVRYHLAARALEEGRVAFARAELATLFEDPAIPAGLRLQVQYTLSIALMQSGQAGRAVELLEDMRASAPSHPGSIHLPDVLGELAAALLAVGRPADAYERAGEAIALVESDGKTNVIARINRGAAALTLRRFDDARNDLLAALQASIAGRDLARAGTAAENLARTELAAGQHGRSHVWAELARRAYQVARPQLLPRLASVLAAVDVAGVPPGESPRPREAEELERFLDALTANQSAEHLTVLELDLYAFLRGIAGNEQGFHTTFPVPPQPGEVEQLIRLLAAEIESIVDHPFYPAIVEDRISHGRHGSMRRRSPRSDAPRSGAAAVSSSGAPSIRGRGRSRRRSMNCSCSTPPARCTCRKRSRSSGRTPRA